METTMRGQATSSRLRIYYLIDPHIKYGTQAANFTYTTLTHTAITTKYRCECLLYVSTCVMYKYYDPIPSSQTHNTRAKYKELSSLCGSRVPKWPKSAQRVGERRGRVNQLNVW